ncbi:hypothetical protein B6I21_06140 [candidate division KSB1 bacterium 4572_119]|nr:MAG: hypothetical protein B6I21_06140 [candidate division KSB1 bacterium 4572_119]
MKQTLVKSFLFISIIGLIFSACQKGGQNMSKSWLKTNKVIASLKEKFGDEFADRIETGVAQAADLWTKEDGTAEDFASFCEANFITDEEVLNQTFLRFDKNLEQINGLNLEMLRTLQEPVQLEIGQILPVDMLFANYDPFAHVGDDLFKNKIAFAALLNFPHFSLKERLEFGSEWSREDWAKARLVQRFSTRIPSHVLQGISEAMVAADNYISNYNIHMHHLRTPDGDRLFPEGLRLITHWGLRDELKAQYANPEGLERQKMIKNVMEHIINQTIPEVVIDNPEVDWDPESNTVTNLNNEKISDAAEPNTRYEHLLNIFQAQTKADPYSNLATYIDRKFQETREIPEQQFEELLTEILSANVAKDVAGLIKKRLGRELEPFDVWYNGFKPRGAYDEQILDEIVGKRYPNVENFQKDIPYILRNLGFTPEKAKFLGSKIVVDPSRGAGHAMGAARREDNAHLRTRIPETGMKYKGYNIAVHELGHNVEQVLSLNGMDYVLLEGVPNTAFTEGFAFVFQGRDLSLLGLKKEDPMAEHMKALDTFWGTFEIAGVGIVDMRIWRWMYEHPKATPEQLKQATIQIAKDVWNEFFAPVLGMEDQILLSIYSHIIDVALYTPDYSLGHIISFQIEQYLKDKNLGTEMERMCKLGSITPDAWMNAAVGEGISTAPLISAAELAVKKLR